MIQQAIKKIIQFQDLTIEEAKQAMDEVLDGGATPAQVSAFLIGLRMKGESIDEITGCALTMKQKASHIKPRVGGYLDCVGTGGDGANTFNISTTASFVIAAAGVPIAKHGNRAFSSRSGSAVLLEELGVNIMLEPEKVQQCVEETGIGFMFARTFHKYMKTASQVRAELKVRTIFNILGPISNPSDAKYQFIGVFDPKLTHPLASAMAKMGVMDGMVMCGVDNGMDEFSTLGETRVAEIKNGEVLCYTATPEQYGLPRAAAADIQGGTARENAKITRDILEGQAGPKRDIVVLNAGASIYCAGRADSVRQGVLMAQKALDSGRALEKLNALIKRSNEV